MSNSHDGPTIRLSARQYRWLDRTTKLTGVALIAAGLEAGGDTTTGLVLAVLGVAVGVSTVVVDTTRDSNTTSESQRPHTQ